MPWHDPHYGTPGRHGRLYPMGEETVVTRHIDREAGFATFRQGRSLCVRLDGALGMQMAQGVAEQVQQERGAVRLRLECSTLERVDPAALRYLASVMLDWAQAVEGRSVDVLNLDPALQRRIAWHPLQALADPDELVFVDPDRDPASDPVHPSRH